MIWQKQFTLESLNNLCQGCMLEHLGITFTEFGDDYMIAKMPVDARTKQPFGLLHGGASVVLAETVASVAANMACSSEHSCLGLEINANHVQSAHHGFVYAKATPEHLGATTQVWLVKITNDRSQLVCSCRTTVIVRRHMQRQ